MALVRNIGCDRAKKAIVRGVIRTCADLDIAIVAEGVETYDEFSWLAGSGIELFQGFFFARPGFEHLPAVPKDRMSLSGLDAWANRHSRR